MAKVVTVDFNANVARFTSAIDKATNDLNKFQSNAQRMANNVKDAFAGVLAGLSVAGIASVVKKAIDAQDALAKMAVRTGFAVETLAGLQHAASLSGTSMEAIEKALKAVSTQAFDASTGLVESRRNFSALGVAVTDSSGKLKPMESLLFEVADRLANTKDITLRNALAFKVFGRSAGELMPLLSGGAEGMRKLVEEGKKLNPVTAESARQAEAFNDNMERLQKTMATFSISVVNDILPGLSQMARILANARMQGEGLWSSLMKTQLPAELKRNMERLDWLRNEMKSTAKVNLPVYEAEATALERRNSVIYAELSGVLPPETDKPKGGAGAKPPRTGESEAEKAAKAAQAQLDAYKKQLALGEEATELEKIRYEIEHGRYKFALPAQKEMLKFLAADLDAQKAINAERIKGWKELEEEADAIAGFPREIDTSEYDRALKLHAEAKEIIEATITPMERLRKEHEQLARVRHLIGEDAFNRGMEAARERFLAEAVEVKKETEDTQNMAKDLGLTFTSAFESAISGGRKLSEVFKGLARDIAMLMIRKNLTEPFLDWFGGMLGGGGFYKFGGRALDVGNVSAMPNAFAMGNAFDSRGVIPFANGGIVSRPTLFPFAKGTGLMGEAGPEAIMPLKRGRDGKLGIAGGGGVTITQNITVTGGASRQDVMAAMSAAKESAKREILEDMRRGGVFS